MPTVLLLHGALATERQMMPLASLLVAHEVHAPTLSGHGIRAKEPLNFGQLVEDIDVVVRRSSGSRVHLFGYSMGGYAALLYAARFPERVGSVTTLGTILDLSQEKLEKELRKLDPAVMEAKVPAFARTLAELHGEEQWRNVVAAVADNMAQLAASPLLTEETIARIQCPVLVAVGELDTSSGLEGPREFASRAHQARVLVLQRVRHPFEDVDLVALAGTLEHFWAASGTDAMPGAIRS